MRKPRTVGTEGPFLSQGKRARSPARGSEGSREERLELLELLTSAGVAMSGSFDIRDILNEIRSAASRILGRGPVEVLYCGRSSINSRPLWSPGEPFHASLSAEQREELERRLAMARPQEGPPEEILARDSGGGRGVLPLRHQDELLGVVFFARPEPLRAERTQLLGILAQQAATALRNIHLTQERIHFERLSTMGRMIGTIVHDLRSPLTALRGYASMMANLDLEEGERREYGGFLLDECDRLNHMVAELLEFTRGGRTELAPQWFPLADYLKEIAERLHRHYGSRGIRVDLRVDYDGEILADRSRLDRALWNLAANACQAMPGGGVLQLRARDVRGELRLEVEDEGSGIPEEIRHRIFEPFFSYGKSEGIGLGMATAKKIVEDHRGRIELGASSGTGALVVILLPIAGPRIDDVRAAESSLAKS
jgi:signal transduction histidine kinase